MKKLLPILLLLVALLLLPIPALAQSWTAVTMPSAFATNGNGRMMPANDGNVYIVTRSGASGSYVQPIYKASLSSVAGGSPTWTLMATLTSATCPHCGYEVVLNDYTSPNGTLFLAISSAGLGGSYADILYWNGSAFVQVTGFNGIASTFIYPFASDSTGKFYFQAAWSGDEWAETAVNGTTVADISGANVYTLASSGAQTGGGTYAMKIINAPVNVTSGDNIWQCGEGNVLDSSLNFATGSGTTYLPTGTYTGNCLNLAYDPTGNSGQGTLLVTRTKSFPNALSSINMTTGAVTDYSTPIPWTAPHGISVPTANGIDSLSYLYGHNFVFSGSDSGGTYLLESADDGVTWADITSGIPASCSGSNLARQDLQTYQPSNYIIARCQGGADFAIYGPLNSLTLTQTIVGSGSVSGSNCASGSYSSGTSIGACTATPSAGWVFSGWSGTLGCTGTSTCSGTLTSSSTMIATFTASIAVVPNVTAYPFAVLKNSVRQISTNVTLGGSPCAPNSISGLTVTGGTGWALWDTGVVVQGGGIGGDFQVTGVSSGAITSITTYPGAQGIGYTVASGLSVTDLSGSGTGGTANITSTSPSTTCSGLITWTVSGTTGGASATFTDTTHTAAGSIPSGLPTIQVNIGSTAGTCSLSPGSGSAGPYTFSSTATVTVLATSVDDATKTGSFTFNVCANSSGTLANSTPSTIIAPAYQQAYKSQVVPLQSWVTGCVDETGTWSITSSPGGGNATLTDTTSRDAQFNAGTVTGRYQLTYTNNCNSGTGTAIVYVSPNSLPSYAATPNATRPHECYVDPALTGGDYEVGAGKTYATIAATPAFTSWTAGTIMRITNSDLTGLNPSQFNEYMTVFKNGTATQPIIICGVPDSLGNLPVMDGTNATAQSDTSTAAGDGIITLWPGSIHFGYWQGGSLGPSYVSITGLHLRNANSTLNRYPPGSGITTAWSSFSSCINDRSGSYHDFSGDELDNCSNGYFNDDNANNGWAAIVQNVSMFGSHIQYAGDPAAATSTHGLYVQNFYGVFEGNLINNPTAYIGAEVKWRGVEGLFRYNFIGNGALRPFDLVDNEDGYEYMTLEGYLGSNGLYQYGDTAGANVIVGYFESAQKDFIYGNIIQSGSSLSAIHYFADHGLASLATRTGTLYAYSNTIDDPQNIFDNGDGALGGISYLGQQFDWRNNIAYPRTNRWNGFPTVYFTKYTQGITRSVTNLTLTGITIASPILGQPYSNAEQLGWNPACNVASTCQWPQNLPLNTYQYGLTNANFLTTSTLPYNTASFIPASGSAAVAAGTALTGVPAQSPIRWQWNVATNSLTARTRPLDIGAEDYPGVTYTLTTTVIGGGAVNSTNNCASGSYASGTSIGACTATAAGGWVFAGWSGTLGCTGTSTCSGTLSGNATIVATFNSLPMGTARMPILQ